MIVTDGGDVIIEVGKLCYTGPKASWALQEHVKDMPSITQRF